MKLTHLLVEQKMAFNSPVWFNVGVQPSRNARRLHHSGAGQHWKSIMGV